MIERYSNPEMSGLWGAEHKFRSWLRVEAAVCEGWGALGVIPSDALGRIREKAGFSVERISELELETRHDVVAFLQNVSEFIGEDSRYFHFGVTSSDIIDTATALLLVESLDLIGKRIDELLSTLSGLASRYKYTPAVGRTHGVHSEPSSFGLKFLLWYSEMMRHKSYVPQVREEIAVGKISGAVGTYATVDPAVEAHVCQKLGLEPALISTQILQRERHARYVLFISLLGCSIEKIAMELRHLQRTEVFEASEGFGKKQKGSSAMPHKRNPVSAENLCGLARVLRANGLAAMENIPLWHERDISHSSCERIILPDSSILIEYMLTRLNSVLKGLDVYPDRMKENLGLTRGLIFSQRVLVALMDKGIDRNAAYQIVQDCARKVWANPDLRFLDVLDGDEQVKKHFTSEELASLFDYAYYMRHVDEIFSRFGL